MQRDYLNYVKDACTNGMTASEMQYLFNDLYTKSDTKTGKRVLRLFARGIGRAKQNTLDNNYNKGKQYQYHQ